MGAAFIEIRRHSARIGRVDELSDYGVRLADAAGQDLEFGWVVASSTERAGQTAEHLAGRCDERAALLDPMDRVFASFGVGSLTFDAVGALWANEDSWARQHGNAIAAFADVRAAAHGSTLLVSHAGVAELAALALTGGNLPPDVPTSLGHCDAIRVWRNPERRAEFVPAPWL